MAAQRAQTPPKPGKGIGMRPPLRDKIKYLFWDVDGTFFRKTPEINRAQKLLFYNAFHLLGKGVSHEPGNIRNSLVFRNMENVPPELAGRYEAMMIVDGKKGGKYASNGLLLMGEFGVSREYGPLLLSNVPYGELLGKDEGLICMFAQFAEQFPALKHSILTDDVYETVSAVCAALGLDMEFFREPEIDRLYPFHSECGVGVTGVTGDSIRAIAKGKPGILCAYNTLANKPDNPEHKPFRQMLEVSGLQDEPSSLLYIGDSQEKDILPAKAQGITTALVWSDNPESPANYTLSCVHGIISLF
jgi:hypothetical protein